MPGKRRMPDQRCKAGRPYDPLPMRKAELPEPES
jgi:hypothetical protein